MIPRGRVREVRKSWFVTCSPCGKSVVYESGYKIPKLCPACAEKVKKEAKGFLEKEERRKVQRRHRPHVGGAGEEGKGDLTPIDPGRGR